MTVTLPTERTKPITDLTKQTILTLRTTQAGKNYVRESSFLTPSSSNASRA